MTIVFFFSLRSQSIFGAVRTGAYMVYILMTKGLKQSVCDQSFYNGPVSKFWAYAFVLSKAPELGEWYFFKKKIKTLWDIMKAKEQSCKRIYLGVLSGIKILLCIPITFILANLKITLSPESNCKMKSIPKKLGEILNPCGFDLNYKISEFCYLFYSPMLENSISSIQ